MIVKHSCSKLHCQHVFELKLYFYKVIGGSVTKNESCPSMQATRGAPLCPAHSGGIMTCCFSLASLSLSLSLSPSPPVPTDILTDSRRLSHQESIRSPLNETNYRNIVLITCNIRLCGTHPQIAGSESLPLAGLRFFITAHKIWV